MQIDMKDAEEALNEVAIIERRTKLYTSLKGSDWISYLWGGIWVGGFTIQHLLRSTEGTLSAGGHGIPISSAFWPPLVIIGFVAGGLLISRSALVRSERERELGKAIGFMWFSLYAFMGFWMTLAAAGTEGPMFISEAGERIVTAIYATIPMLALLIMGLFMGSRFLILESVAITVLTALGLLITGEYFYLYMAIVGGGILVGSGVAVQIALRRPNDE